MEQILLDNIVNNEIYAPVNFADFQKKDWGILFYDGHNPKSYDSNHAVITEQKADFFEAAEQTKDFYLSKGLVPRIRLPIGTAPSDKQRLELERAGFFSPENAVVPPSDCENVFCDNRETVCMIKKYPAPEFSQGHFSVSRQDLFGDELCFGLFGTGDEFIKRTVNRLCGGKKGFFFVGRLFSDGVSICTVEEGERLCRLSNVFTAAGFRNCGFGTKTAAFALGYYEKQCKKPIYLLTENTAAISIYRRLGFERVAQFKRPFSAVWREQI